MEQITCTSIEETDILSNLPPRSWERKEQIAEFDAIVFDHKTKLADHPVRVRWYAGRSSGANTVYCIVAINTTTLHTHGHGSAGGGGYDKLSASLADALSNANVELSHSIHGTGRHQDAIRAIVDYLWPTPHYTLEITGRG